jgi:hypothetical protein
MAFTRGRIGIATCAFVVAALVMISSSRLSFAGEDNSRAYGPYVTDLNTQPQIVPGMAARDFVRKDDESESRHRSHKEHIYPVPPADTAYVEASHAMTPLQLSVPAPLPPTTMPDTTPASFYASSAYDISVATDGNYIVNASNSASGFVITDMTGATTYVEEDEFSFFCATNTLPICSDSGFPGDMRIVFDTVAGRWIVSAMWVHGSRKPTSTVLAVSATASPLGKWYKYQFPQCGPNDILDGSDQPHLGFSKYWIAINSACTASFQGYSLNLLDKATLYRGGRLCGPNALHSCSKVNWWEYQDKVSNDDGRDDNPVTTYTDATSRQYFTHTQIANGLPKIVYSYINGSEFNPSPHWGTSAVVVTGDQVTGERTLRDAPVVFRRLPTTGSILRK